MKKLLIYLPAIVGLLWSCNPMEDTYNQLDNKLEPYKQNISYTLVTADYSTASKAALVDALNASDTVYAKLIASQLAFNTRFTANNYVGPVLAKVFPALNAKSSAKVTYTTGLDQPTYLNDLKTVNIITTAEYQTAWGDPIVYVSAFTPAKSPSTKIPSILAARFPSATNGTYKFVEYNYSSTEASSGIVDYKYFYDDFETHTCATSSPYTPIGENGWQQKDTSGTKGVWNCRTFSSNKYAQITSNATNELNNSFLLTKQIDLTYAIAPEFTFNVNVGYWNADCLTVLVSEDFDGNKDHIKNATWVDLTSDFTFPQIPTSGYGVLASAGTSDLSSYIGKKIYIAFKYSGDSRTATVSKITTTYQVDNVKVSEMRTALSVPSTEKQYVVYKYNGTTWITPLAADGIFISLQPVDYTAMGLSYISSANVPLYLPQYLKQKFPYALEGDIKTLVYKSSATITYSGATQYVLKNGVWASSTFKEIKTDQFVHTGVKWIFDPTVYLLPSTADFQLLVDWVYANKSRTYGSSYGNDEFYYGASAYYKNFDLRLSNRATYNIPGFDTGTEAEKVAKTWSMLEEGIAQMLVLKYPNAQTDVTGIPIYYWVTFNTYENDLSKNVYVGIYQCSTPGTPPVFIRVKAVEDAQVAAGNLTAVQVKWNRPTTK